MHLQYQTLHRRILVAVFFTLSCPREKNSGSTHTLSVLDICDRQRRVIGEPSSTMRLVGTRHLYCACRTIAKCGTGSTLCYSVLVAVIPGREIDPIIRKMSSTTKMVSVVIW